MKKIFLIICVSCSSFLIFAGPHIEIVPRENKIKNFPCMECHKQSLSKAVKNKKDHRELVLKHMPEVGACFLCHSKTEPNKLNLLEGQKLGFNEAYTLCGQCHGLRLAEWRESIHGKQKGSWAGDKIKLSCTECHDAHNPKFPKFKAVPPPKRPKKAHFQEEK
ncbi:MAG TPA: hypothetical protein VJB34_00760 [Bdellovibrionota bacterium]|nr:hypothetical protein [Bdellovibrionota bacterium]